MSELKINTLKPIAPTGTTIIGKSGDTITIPSGVTIANSGTATGFAASDIVKISNVTDSTRSTHSGANSAWYAITARNLTHQASSTSNKLLFIAQNVGSTSPQGSSWTYRFWDRTNNDEPNGGNANLQGSRARANSKVYCDATSWGSTSSMMAWVTPASTSAIEYGIDVKHQHDYWISNGNYDNTDTGTVDRSRALSTFTIIEFASAVIK